MPPKPLALQQSIDPTMAVGIKHHQAGDLTEAEKAYRQVLTRQPKDFNALHLLGVVALQTNRIDEAIDLISKAIALSPNAAEFHLNLGNALRANGRLEDAVVSFRCAIQLKPRYAQAQNNLANALYDLGSLDEAIAAYREAIQISPTLPGPYDNLGVALRHKGLLTEAAGAFMEALRRDPNFAKCYSNLGNALRDQGLMDQAIGAYHQAIRLEPNNATFHNNLGIALRERDLLDDAIASFRRAIELRPDYSDAYNNLGIALRDRGEIAESLAACRKAVELNPASPIFHGNLVLIAHYQHASDPQSLLAEARRWARVHAEPLKSKIVPHANDRSPDRRLKIGYVSPDFRIHPVGRFIATLLEAHDPSQVEIYCYAQVPHDDAITARIRKAAHHWRGTVGQSDDQTARQIREDQIDILVDLAAHTGCNRLAVFAQKPAPVQVTYLAYAGTTGLDTVDYRITDPHLDPPGLFDDFYSEKSIRIESYWCYEPPLENLPESSLPSAQAGFITFGCLNNFFKISSETLQTWCAILAAVPKSQLLIYAPPGSHRERIAQSFDAAGIDRRRLTFVPKLPLADYLNQYRHIDIALDPFPYVGGTTTCDALWMGVPVITVPGKTAVSRGGISILTNIGLPQLIAADTNDYIRLATDLANNPARLAEFRSTLREKMRSSPLMNAPRFARQIETAYREMWRSFCA